MRGIRAYDAPDRVGRYDAEMEIMHPNRAKMVEVAMQVLPFSVDAAVTVVDLGVGTGFLTARFLEAFPNGQVIGLDGAPAMIELAKSRLAEVAGRVEFRVGDFQEIGHHLSDVKTIDAVLSAYALHHLRASEKLEVLRQCMHLLRPGGWLVNADLVVAESPAVEARIQHIRVEGIVRRARERDDRFKTIEGTRRFLAELESREGDQPIALAEDLSLLRASGAQDVTVFWQEFREVVYGGQRAARCAV